MRCGSEVAAPPEAVAVTGPALTAVWEASRSERARDWVWSPAFCWVWLVDGGVEGGGMGACLVSCAAS